MKARYMIVASLVVLALVVVGCVKPAPAPPAPEVTPEVTPEVEEFVMPEMIYATCYGVGSNNHLILTVYADAMMKKYDVNVRVLPGGTGVSRGIPLRSGDVHIWGEGGAHFTAYEGIFEFGDSCWGPQDLRAVWVTYPTGANAMATPCDANIKTPADLKGKKVPWVTANPGQQLINTGYLAFGGLTWDDVIKVEFPDWQPCIAGMMEGKVHCAPMTTHSPIAYEMAGSPRGLCWPRFDPDDKEAWARMAKFNPYTVPAKVSDGAGMELGKVYEVSNTGVGLSMGVYASESEEFVYNLAKMLNESYDLYKDQPVMENAGPEIFMAAPGGYLPWHEGTVRYLKELGYWTAEWEAWQNAFLERGKVLRATWEVALEEAEAKKITTGAWPDFWMGKRAEALKKAGLPVYTEF